MKCVRKYLFTGPECAGKTTGAMEFANLIDGRYVEEVARGYLERHGPDYTLHDVIDIGKLQLQSEAQYASDDKDIVCDTSLLVLYIWIKEKFDREIWSVAEVRAHLASFDLVVLCEPDIPWLDDGLRENPHDRHRLFDVYRSFLEENDVPFVKLFGDNSFRKETLDNLASSFLKS